MKSFCEYFEIYSIEKDRNGLTYWFSCYDFFKNCSTMTFDYRESWFVDSVFLRD